MRETFLSPSFYFLIYLSNILCDIFTIQSLQSFSKDCQQGSLNATLAAGKIILCFSRSGTQDIQSAAISVMQAGGVGLIYAQFHADGLDSCNLIPCIKVNYEVGTRILSYIRRARCWQTDLRMVRAEILCVSKLNAIYCVYLISCVDLRLQS